MRRFWNLWVTCVAVLYGGVIVSASTPPAPIHASVEQQTCGVVDSSDDFDYPVDTTEFQLINPFMRPNARFEGQLHAGDDWVKREGPSLGLPVRAFAPGRVTYSNPEGWGRDRGVVIVEHSFPTGTVYSLYGHMEESGGYLFPTLGTCVNKGDIVGAISDPRPAPHLHFEIRTMWPNYPGPGYWTVDPRLRGWLNPRQFIENWRGWLNPAHRWHTTLLDESGPHFDPIFREDGILLFVDGNQYRAYNNEAGRLWEYRLADSIEVVGFAGLADGASQVALIGAADGRVQIWNQYGGFLEEWSTGLAGIAQGPMVLGQLILLVDTNATLHVYDLQRQPIAEYSAINRIVTQAASPQFNTLLTSGNELLMFSSAGELMERVDILPNSDLAAAPDGTIYLRNQGTLQTMSPAGSPATLVDNLEINRTDSTMLATDLGLLVTWGVNGKNTLSAFSAEGKTIWTTEVGVENLSHARLVEANACTLVLADQTGHILAFDTQTGTPLGQVSVWGDYRNEIWLGSYPNENLLRVMLSNQLLGLDLDILAGRACD
ncbi:MAG: M23 family metallopeptidase [Chloroflexi bacterium]|nr:M23 family metallopeptidase [Chloroflexota bacterium]